MAGLHPGAIKIALHGRDKIPSPSAQAIVGVRGRSLCTPGAYPALLARKQLYNSILYRHP